MFGECVPTFRRVPDAEVLRGLRIEAAIGEELTGRLRLSARERGCGDSRLPPRRADAVALLARDASDARATHHRFGFGHFVAAVFQTCVA